MEPDKIKTLEPHRLDFLDGLRGIAILSVYLFHTLSASFGFDSLPWSGEVRNFDVPFWFLSLLPLCFGFLGVAAFFVLSGFCIHLSHSRSGEKSFEVFFLRRFFRIYPPFLISLLAFALIPPFTYNFAAIRTLDGWLSLGSHLALAHNLTDHYHSTINGSFWSIAVEAQLYLLYPLLWYQERGRSWFKMLILSGVIELTVRTIVSTNSGEPLPHWFTGSPFLYWFSWCLGVNAAECYIKGIVPVVPMRALAAVSSLAVLAYLFRATVIFVFPLAALVSSGIICRLLWRPKNQPLVSNHRISQALESLGIVSYSFYLIHQPLLGQISRVARKILPNNTHPLIYFSVCLASLIPIYWLSVYVYRVVEVPSIRAGKFFIAKRRLKNFPV